MQRNSVTVRIPASTSNLGSGFDTLGLALRLYNFIRVARGGDRGVQIATPMPARERAKVHGMAVEAAELFFRRVRTKPFGITLALGGDIPNGRGLGASATLRLGVAAALNELTGARLDRIRLLELVTDLEGHPDNASPAIFGGFTVSGRVGNVPPAGPMRCLSFHVSPKLKFVTLIPRIEMPTAKARRLLPDSYSKSDTTHALNRAALISAALSSGNFDALQGLFDDRVHQPYRARLLSRLGEVIRAGERAGALGGFLSGAGSAIVCLTLRTPRAVAQAMHRQLPDSEMRILTADNHGFTILNPQSRR